MSIPSWIDCDFLDLNVHELGYLVETLNTSTGRTSWSLRDRPLRTNQTNEPRLAGWCGETDNRSRYACGVVRVVRTNRALDRVQIAQVTGPELAAFLEEDGHPELAPA